jgi:hypothetical protein
MEAPLAFATLFLGLITGPQEVVIEVTDRVAAVEIQLDEATVARLERPPFHTAVDFGPALAPHRLSAVAFDARGHEVGRVHQWVNAQRPQAEIALLVDRGPNGRPIRARWLGSAVQRELDRPQVEMTIDGRRLAVDASGAALLPELDLRLPHLLSASVRFGAAATAHHDVVLGGGVNDETRTELTSTIFRPKPNRRAENGAGSSLDTATLTARVGARTVRVVATDRAGSTVVIVRPARFSTSSAPWLEWLPVPPAQRAAHLGEAMLAPGVTTRFLWPYPTLANGARPSNVFPTSGAQAATSGGLRWLFGSAEGNDLTGPALFADAVALAGAQAQASGTRAAVLLLLDEQSHDPSRFSPAQVGAYLERLRIPLFVWTVPSRRAIPLVAAWRSEAVVAELRGPLGFKRAVQALLDDLEQQVVVWIEGGEVPGSVEVAGDSHRFPR